MNCTVLLPVLITVYLYAGIIIGEGMSFDHGCNNITFPAGQSTGNLISAVSIARRVD
jgi:hypothetical protein